MEHQDKNSKFNIWGVLSAVFAIGAIICIGILIKMSIDQKQRAENMSNLVSSSSEGVISGEVISSEVISSQPSEDYPSKTESSVEESSSTEEVPVDTYAESVKYIQSLGIEIPELVVDIAELQESTNKDIYAWIYVPGTKVNYPILQHPTDDSYYLNYNIDGTKGYPGCIYSEKTYNSQDFMDGNTVLYGHNMKNGTMFGSIHKYEDSEFFAEHPYIFVYTPERLLCYRIFAAYEHVAEHLLYNYDFNDPSGLRWYFDLVKINDKKSVNCNFADDMEFTGEEHIITLSTCINNKPDKRYLVQGVLLNEE